MFSFAASGEVNEKIKLESFSAVFFLFSDTGESLQAFIHATRKTNTASTEKKKKRNILKVHFVIKDMLVLLLIAVYNDALGDITRRWFAQFSF